MVSSQLNVHGHLNESLRYLAIYRYVEAGERSEAFLLSPSFAIVHPCSPYFAFVRTLSSSFAIVRSFLFRNTKLDYFYIRLF